MVDVFISYKRRLRPTVEQIADALRQLQLDVWFDMSLRPGTTFSAEISKAVRSAKAVLVCWSNDAFPHGGDDRGWVVGEAMIGFDRKVLVPTFVEPAGLDPPFNTVHTVDLIGWRRGGEEKGEGWRTVVNTIGDLVGRPDLGDYERLRSTGDQAGLARWADQHLLDPLSAHHRVTPSKPTSTTPSPSTKGRSFASVESMQNVGPLPDFIDCYLSFAAADNIPVKGARAGWVDIFTEALSVLLRQRLGGREVALFSAGLVAPNEIGSAIRRSRVFVAFASQNYFRSIDAKKEVQLRMRAGEGNLRQTVVVQFEPMSRKAFPGASAYLKFWDDTPHGAQTLGFPEPTATDRLYYERVYDVAMEIVQLLKN